MLVSKAVYHKEEIAFHLFFVSDKNNSIFCTIPSEILDLYLQKQLYHLKHSIIVNEKMAKRYVDEIAYSIVCNKSLHPFFYPKFLSHSGVAFDQAEKLISYQDNFIMNPGMVYCEALNSLEFSYMRQRFLIGRSQILKFGNRLTNEVFESIYIQDEASRTCYEDIRDKINLIIEGDDEQVECAFILNEQHELLLVVTA